ncbi:MAG: GDP-mannose 4,6-dehydratase [Vulcanimicrobiota bacterium]
MKKIFITGGAGFIGSNFIRIFLDKHPDVKVICFDALTYAGNMDNLNDVQDNRNFEFIKGDIRNQKQVEAAMDGCDGVIHFAAESHVDRSIVDANAFLTTNILEGKKVPLYGDGKKRQGLDIC